MKKLIFSVFVFNLIFNYSFSQNTFVRWRTFAEVDSLFKVQQRPIFINLYNSAVDSCKQMMAETFANETVAAYLNGYYYAINFDIASKETVRFFNGTSYKPEADGVHGLTRFLGFASIESPSYVVFNKEGAGALYQGFKTDRQLFPILIYYGEDAYKTSDYDTYFKYYDKVYPTNNASGVSMVRSVAKWMTLEEALEKQKTEPRKIFLDLNVRWRNTSTIMLMQTYNNQVIGNYLNEKFYPVKIDANEKDTIAIRVKLQRNGNGVAFSIQAPLDKNAPIFNFDMFKFPPEKQVHEFDARFIFDGTLSGYHQFPVALLNGRMVFPSVLVFDEKGTLVNTEQGYFTPEGLEPMLHFFVEEHYKTTSLAKFKETFKSGIK